MRKIYSLVLSLAIVNVASAQTRTAKISGTAETRTGLQTKHISEYKGNPNVVQERAIGDTIFWWPLNTQYFVTPEEEALNGRLNYALPEFVGETFDIVEHDVDLLDVATQLAGSAYAPKSSFIFFYQDSLKNLDGTPSQVGAQPDSLWYFGATSWFTPAAQANNWLVFGPISVPATGMNIAWKAQTPDADWRDAYEVRVGYSGDPADLISEPVIWSVADQSTSLDTNDFNVQTTRKSVNLPAEFNGAVDVFIAFHHNATDMFTINLSDFLFTEANVVAVKENEFVSSLSTYPNPAHLTTNVSYVAKQAGNVVITLSDLSGRTVNTVTNNSTVGLNRVAVSTDGLSAGLYNCTLTLNGVAVGTTKVVVE